MRILAIRGSNLASLRGPFEVDLEKPPLSHLGLFAIAGPVGAGKSTLLDAMCLALFARTPRLSGRGGTLLARGDDAVRANDPRQLVRRGVSQAHAEVDFTARDGRVLRARWSVRRARGQSFGKLQADTVTLVDRASGQRLGENKEDTLALIAELLGLTFDEFCRSVLIAQGGFAAFLNARPDDRAALLERLTGSRIYSKLSAAAFERARAAQAKVNDLLAQAAARAPRGDLWRAARVTDAAAAEAELQRAERAWTAARQAADVQAQRADASGRWTDAQHTVERLQHAVTALNASVALGLADLWPLRALLQRAEAAAHAHAHAAREEQRAESEALIARERRSATAAALGDHEEQVAAAAAVAAREDVELDKARLLDAQLAEVAAAHAALSARHAAARSDNEKAQAALRVAERTHHARAAEREALRIEADAEPFTEVLVAHGDAIAALLQRSIGEVTRAEGAQALLQMRVERAEAAHADHAAADADLARRRAALRGAAGVVEQRLAALQLAVQHQAVELEAERRGLLRLSALQVRLALTDGAPCPVCGSAEHPAPAPLDAAARLLVEGAHEQQARVDAAQELWTALHEAQAEIASGWVQRVRPSRHGALTADAGGASALLAGRAARAARTNVQPALPFGAAVATAAGEPTAVLAAARAAWAHFEAACDSADAALALAEDLEGQRDEARALVVDATSSLAGAMDACAQTDAALAAAVGPAVDLVTGGDRRAVLACLQARCEAARRLAGACAAVDAALAAAAGAVAQHTMRADGARARATELADLVAAEEARRAALAHSRAALLNGRAIAEVQAERAASRAALADALQAARAAAVAQVAAAAAAEARVVELRAQALHARAVAIETAAAVDAARATTPAAALDPARIHTMLALSDDALDRARSEQAVLGEQLAVARALMAEQQRAWERLGGAAAEAFHAPAAAQLEAAEQAHRRAHAALAAIAAEIAADDAAADQARAVGEQLDASRADAATWTSLSELIGSSDGGRFRRYAQSLTLDTLLVHANQHLELLRPRYRIERAPEMPSAKGTSEHASGRHDLELCVVDRDNGDEARSTASLSGGESFLVSLALALGLSSLASPRTRVESLFIDEGFSSLDPDTLEAALAAFDALRSTGRQVGVISHVPALAERLGAQVRVVPLGDGRSRVDVAV